MTTGTEVPNQWSVALQKNNPVDVAQQAQVARITQEIFNAAEGLLTGQKKLVIHSEPYITQEFDLAADRVVGVVGYTHTFKVEDVK